jgi:hypothetical protein
MTIQQGERIPRDTHRRLEVQCQRLELINHRGWYLDFYEMKRHPVEAKILSPKSGRILGAGGKEFRFQGQALRVLPEASLCNVIQLCLGHGSVQ